MLNGTFETLSGTVQAVAGTDTISSGNLLVRAGMIKKTSAGIYMIMPMGKKV